MLAALAFPESIREDQAMIQSAEARANMAEHGTTEPSGAWEAEREAADRTLYDETLILRAEHVLGFGILLFTAGGACLLIHLTRRTPPSKST